MSVRERESDYMEDTLPRVQGLQTILCCQWLWLPYIKDSNLFGAQSSYSYLATAANLCCSPLLVFAIPSFMIVID